MKQNKPLSVIYLQQIETPIGALVICASEKGICLVEFADIQDLEREYQRICKAKQARIIESSSDLIEQLKGELDAYFKGELKAFTVPLDLIGTEFQQTVWQGLCTIPYGQTKSYKEQAEFLQLPKSIRAVANANGQNRMALVIPCHRIIGTDRSLTGYRGGIWRKKFLLELENKAYNKTEQLSLALE